MCNMQEAVVLEARRRVDADFKRAKKEAWKDWTAQQLQQLESKLKTAKASEIFRILKPKKMVDRKNGRHRKPLPGLQDAEGTWCTSRVEIAMAWQCQFEGIENAQKTHMRQMLDQSTPKCQPIAAEQLLQLPTIWSGRFGT